MPVTIDQSNNPFFDKCLGHWPDVLGKLAVLKEAYGVVFTLDLYVLKAKVKHESYMIELKTSSSSVMKAPSVLADPEVTAATVQVKQFIEQLYSMLVPNSPLPEFQKIPPGGLQHPQAPAPAVADEPPVAKTAKSVEYGDVAVAEPVIKHTVIKLAEAEAIGQQVKGSSVGSVYRLIAANARVKVAARLEGQQLSLRVEWVDPTPDEVALIAKSGVTLQGKHASMHMDIQGIAPDRILGAFIYGMGVKFDRTIKAGEEIKL